MRWPVLIGIEFYALITLASAMTKLGNLSSSSPLPTVSSSLSSSSSSSFHSRKYPVNESVTIEYEAVETQSTVILTKACHDYGDSESFSLSTLTANSTASSNNSSDNNKPLRCPASYVSIQLLDELIPTGNAEPQECIQCIQQLPKCDCQARSDCRLVPQSCEKCAYYECIPTSITQPLRDCVECPPFAPICNCEPGYICMYRHRTCRMCPRIECIKPLPTDNKNL